MTFNHNLLRLAIRARLATLSVVSTGATNLSGAALGYERSAGSFLVDGFDPGMEVDASGFAVANNGKSVLTGVEAGRLHILGGRTVDAEAAARTVSVGFPSRAYWENRDYTPDQDYPYTEEDYLPGQPPIMRGLVPGGTVENYPLYTLKLYLPAQLGSNAFEKYAFAIESLFPAGFAFSLSDGSKAHVRTDMLPQHSPFRNDKPGWGVGAVTLAFWTQSS
jgi:hypothetical protein